jgi:hypothetical protein
MIVKNPSREPPTEWNKADIRELLDHANELASNGNPAGYFVANGLLRANRSFPFSDEEYAVCRTWIEANADLVRTAWQYEVRSDR